MKNVKVLGVIAGAHVFALMLIFVIPGCSSTTKPTPAPVDTIAKSEPAPAISVPGLQAAPAPGASGLTAAPMAFNPDAPALANDGIRFTPTRPGTAAASTLVAAPVTDVTPTKTYATKSGDSLWSIAHKNDLSVSELAAANNLSVSAKLHDGQKLLIPAKHVSPAAAAATSASAISAAVKPEAAPKQSAESIKHTVKPGEVLGTIARAYGVKASDISVANNITDPQKIRAGMVLIIPGYKAVSDKAAKAGAKTPANGAVGKPSATPADAAPIFGPSNASSVPVIGPSSAAPSASPEIPVIKLDDPSAAAKKP